MGSDYSKFLPEIKNIPSNICVIHVKGSTFYGINLSLEIIQSIQEVCKQIWNTEMQIQKYCESIIKFIPIKNMNFTFHTAKNTAKTKQMFCRFQKKFCNFGWSLISSPTLTYQCSLSTWFFYKDINPYMVQSEKTGNDFCVIGISALDKFQFIDFPQILEQPIIDCIKANWLKGIQNNERIEQTDNCWVLQLKGYPWCSSGEDSLNARFLILCLIRFMSHHNWRLVNSTTMKIDGSDTMFFRSCTNAFNIDCPESMPEYYFMLSLMNDNDFSVFGADTLIINTIAESCRRYETKGICPLTVTHNHSTISLVSKVWSRRHEKEMQTKKLMTCLFQELASIGWLPIEAINCSCKIDSLSSIAFVRTPVVRMLYFCLCPRQFTSICLINAVEEVQNIVYNTFVKYYVVEREKIKRSVYGVADSIDFQGSPFYGNNKIGELVFQVALAAIISALKDAGWFLILSADTSNETRTETSETTNADGTKSESTTIIKWSIYGIWFAKILPN